MFIPEPEELREILVQLKNHAPPEYLMAMANDEKYTLVLRKWLGKLLKNPAHWEVVIAPLLQVCLFPNG